MKRGSSTVLRPHPATVPTQTPPPTSTQSAPSTPVSQPEPVKNEATTPVADPTPPKATGESTPPRMASGSGQKIPAPTSRLQAPQTNKPATPPSGSLKQPTASPTATTGLKQPTSGLKAPTTSKLPSPSGSGLKQPTSTAKPANIQLSKETPSNLRTSEGTTQTQAKPTPSAQPKSGLPAPRSGLKQPQR
jgi:hypothetical protein